MAKKEKTVRRGRPRGSSYTKAVITYLKEDQYNLMMEYGDKKLSIKDKSTIMRNIFNKIMPFLKKELEENRDDIQPKP
jgi:hypothetical protein